MFKQIFPWSCTCVKEFVAHFVLIASHFYISFPQAFISKFIWIYYIHKAVQQRSLGSLGAPPLQMNEIIMSISENHGENPKI